MRLAKDTIEGCEVVHHARNDYRVYLGSIMIGHIDKRARHELRWKSSTQLGTASTWREAVLAIKGAHGL